MRNSFWNKIKDVKALGLTSEEFEEIENLESAIAHHQNEIDKFKKEVKHIESTAKLRLENVLA